MVKVMHLRLEDGTCLDVHQLTPQTQVELVMDLVKAGSDTQAVLMKGQYKAVKKVK